MDFFIDNARLFGEEQFPAIFRKDYNDKDSRRRCQMRDNILREVNLQNFYEIEIFMNYIFLTKSKCS